MTKKRNRVDYGCGIATVYNTKNELRFSAESLTIWYTGRPKEVAHETTILFKYKNNNI